MRQRESWQGAIGHLIRACGLIGIIVAASGAQAARLVVDIRFETTDQSIWGNGAAATLPVFGTQLVLDNGDLAAIGVDLSNLDLVVVNAGLNFRAGLDVGLSGDAGRADAALDYQVGLEFSYSDLVTDNWVPMRLVGDHDGSVLSTAFPEIQLHADLVFDVDASIDGGNVFDFDLAAPLFGVNNPGRLIGLDANDSGEIEVLPLVQQILSVGNAVGRLTPDVELDVEIEEESDEEKRRRLKAEGIEPGSQTEKAENKKKAKAKLEFKLPSPIDIDARRSTSRD